MKDIVQVHFCIKIEVRRIGDRAEAKEIMPPRNRILLDQRQIIQTFEYVIEDCLTVAATIGVTEQINGKSSQSYWTYKEYYVY